MLQSVEKIATDIYTFSRLHEDGFRYVDKTDALYAMASGENGVQFFIACQSCKSCLKPNKRGTQ